MLAAVPAAAESTWDQIKRTGQLRYGAIDYPPNWYRDKTTGKWTGFLVEMVEDIAKEMGVEAVPVETTWATCVLDLQSNKTDLQFGLQATPKRALVIDFAGPAYNLYWYAVNHKGFKASTWEDYNKPEVKVAAMLGSADVVILQKVAPKATRVELNDVASDRARRHLGTRRCDGHRRLRSARREEPQPGSRRLRAADADRLSSLLRRLAARGQQHPAKVSAGLGRVEQFARLHGGPHQEISRKRRRDEHSGKRPVLSESQRPAAGVRRSRLR